MIKRRRLKDFVKKGADVKPHQECTNVATHRPSEFPMNDESSGTINMIVREATSKISRRGKKRNRWSESVSLEVMNVSEHSLMIISFSLRDAEGVQMPHKDVLVVEVVIHNFKVQKVQIDDGSKVNLLPYHVYQQMEYQMNR